MYLIEYLVFFILASLKLAQLHLRQHYSVVQVHNMPDFLVFTALLPRLLGARVVLDLHDLVPELYMLKFGGRPEHGLVRSMRWVERQSITFADAVITATPSLRSRLIERHISPNKMTVVMNSADPRLFRLVQGRATHANDNKRFTLMYHGGLFERYGLDVAIKAVERLRHDIPGLRLCIYGCGEEEERLRQLVQDLGLGEHVLLGGWVPFEQIPTLIATADLGVVPYRQNPFTDLLYPTKAFEYIVMGVPVVMARIRAISELFGDLQDMFFEPEDVDDLAARILTLYRTPVRREQQLVAARHAYASSSWENQRQGYLILMQRLNVAPDVAQQLSSISARGDHGP